MKRKLINYQVFEQMEKGSLSSAGGELAEAAPILARALGVDSAELRCFGPDSAVFEASDGSFVNTSYAIDNGYVTFDNIEQLVINEETEVEKSREVLSGMLEAVLEDKTEKADMLFGEFMTLPQTVRMMRESAGAPPWLKDKKDDGGCCGGEKKGGFPFGKKGKKGKKKLKASDAKKKALKLKKSKKDLKEWFVVSETVLDYIDIKENGPALNDMEVMRDGQGEVTAVKIPTLKTKLEGKILSFDWDVLDHKLKLLRSKSGSLSENIEFCKACYELKRHNALSDDDALQEAIENIVAKWPEVLYLTQDELSKHIKTALETTGASNYDDQVCSFMSEGILRVAHGAYVDRAAKVMQLAGATVEENSEDPYAKFAETVNGFYPHLDESNTLEMQVFVDLYESLREVYNVAQEEKNISVLEETVKHLNDLAGVIKQELEPSIDIAEAAAAWLSLVVEANVEGAAADWNVSNSVHTTISGDHPAMARLATIPAIPGRYTGDYPDTAPVSDGKSYKNGLAAQMRNNSYGNIGGPDTYPELKNPYIPKPFGKYEMKGEKGAASAPEADLLAQWSSDSTWPGLQNPYIPKAVTPKTYKMKSDNLIVDK